ncbi:hypothetical protein C9F11_02915 [Streptomyces sp. YIM 121038]|nr:hypothetical protein C9F11_02915 [Streptomyces sp. YIM 121038]
MGQTVTGAGPATGFRQRAPLGSQAAGLGRGVTLVTGRLSLAPVM